MLDLKPSSLEWWLGLTEAKEKLSKQAGLQIDSIPCYNTYFNDYF